MIIYYSTTLNIPTGFGPLGTITGIKPNSIRQHETKLVTYYTADSVCKSQTIKMKPLFFAVVQMLCFSIFRTLQAVNLLNEGQQSADFLLVRKQLSYFSLIPWWQSRADRNVLQIKCDIVM